MEPSECEQKSAKVEVLGIVEPDVGGQIFGLSIQFLRFMSNKEYCELNASRRDATFEIENLSSPKLQL